MEVTVDSALLTYCKKTAFSVLKNAGFLLDDLEAAVEEFLQEFMNKRLKISLKQIL